MCSLFFYDITPQFWAELGVLLPLFMDAVEVKFASWFSLVTHLSDIITYIK